MLIAQQLIAVAAVASDGRFHDAPQLALPLIRHGKRAPAPPVRVAGLHERQVVLSVARALVDVSIPRLEICPVS